MWEREGYQIPPNADKADSYAYEIAHADVAEATKGKRLEALKRYSRWLSERFGIEPWEFEWAFSSSGGGTPRDFLTIDERRAIRSAALETDGNPAYGQHLDADALEALEGGSWKFTSLVWTSLDAGLRPVEVGRARVSWVDTENGVLRIPREESSKNVGNWTVGLTERTATALSRWIRQRETLPRYDDSDRLWLTRQGNPYGSRELGRLLRRLCDRADIPHEHRQMSWYAIRHSVGTYMTKERDLAATKAQLRHRSVATTMKYDQVPVEDRREALDRIG